MDRAGPPGGARAPVPLPYVLFVDDVFVFGEAGEEFVGVEQYPEWCRIYADRVEIVEEVRGGEVVACSPDVVLFERMVELEAGLGTSDAGFELGGAECITGDLE